MEGEDPSFVKLLIPIPWIAVFGSVETCSYCPEN